MGEVETRTFSPEELAEWADNYRRLNADVILDRSYGLTDFGRRVVPEILEFHDGVEDLVRGEPDPTPTQRGARLRDARTRAGLSVDAIVRRVGTKPAAVFAAERGECERAFGWRLRTACAVAAATR